MTYTINGKEWTEFDINKRCAELLGLEVSKEQWMHYGDRDENLVLIGKVRDSYAVNYTRNPADTWHIIEKCWDELMAVKQCADKHQAEWEQTGWGCIMEYHNCTKLTAACICLIEENKA